MLHQNNGEIWAKLDAGTEEYFRLVNRAHIPLATVVDNILQAARTYRVVIQSLWLKVRGNPPRQEEIEAYCGLLNGILARGGHLQGLQIYTIARGPAESYAAPLSREELGRIAAFVRAQVPDSDRDLLWSHTLLICIFNRIPTAGARRACLPR